MTAIEQDLMRGPRRNPYNISGREFLASSTLNGAVALFIWRDSNRVLERASSKKSGGSGLHDHYVHLRLVQFGRTIGVPMNQ